MLLSTRLGERVTLTHGQAVDTETTPLEDPGRLETLLSLRTLRDLSRRDLALLRLLVRARRGRPLQDSTLDQFYSSVAWYHADPTYTDARLTRIDRQNLRLIQTAEAEAGGPLSEADAEFFGGA